MWDWFLSGLTIKVDFLLLWFAVFDFRLCRLCHFGSRHYCWPNLVWMCSVCRWCLTSLMVACLLRPMTSWVILHSKSSPAFKTKKIVWKSKILELVNVVTPGVFRCYTIPSFQRVTWILCTEISSAWMNHRWLFIALLPLKNQHADPGTWLHIVLWKAIMFFQRPIPNCLRNYEPIYCSDEKCL